jgi:hypothetical protein
MAKTAAAILAPHEEEQMRTSDLSGMGGFGGGGMDGGGYTPGKGWSGGGSGPAPKPAVPSGTSIPSNWTEINGMPIAKPGDKPVPPPVVAPPPPTAGDPKITKAEQKFDEEQMHGFAANILAGGMFQSPPDVARNILLGN